MLLAVGLIAVLRPRPPPAAPPELPTLDVTSWTDQSELFMEYPPLVAAQTVRFAVHLTRLSDFSALERRAPAHRDDARARRRRGHAARHASRLRPGAFRVEGRLPPAGRYRWALIVDAPGLADRHDLGVATVFADQAAAVADAETATPRTTRRPSPT